MRLGIKASRSSASRRSSAPSSSALSLHAPRAARAREPRREPRARGAARQRHLPSRPRGRAASGRRSVRRRCATIRGLRSILESSLYSKNVTFAAIVDPDGIGRRARRSDALEGASCRRRRPRRPLARAAALAQLWRIYSDQGRNARAPRSRCCSATREFGSIRIGVSTLLDPQRARDVARGRRCVHGARRRCVAAIGRRDAARAAAAAADSRDPQRPDAARHAASSASRSICRKDEFGELGTFFNTVSAQLSADRSQLAGQVANLESAVEHLEDAVALFDAARRAAVRQSGDARRCCRSEAGGERSCSAAALARARSQTDPRDARQSHGPVSVHVLDPTAKASAARRAAADDARHRVDATGGWSA